MEPFKIGDVVAGKYEITRELGRGGMGVVVAAHQRELARDVALKFLRPSSTDKPESVARFAREARTATRITSEHAVRVHDVGIIDGAPFIVMECLTGEDLARVIKRRGRLPCAEAVDLLLQACEALAEAHTLGIVHRDLKPANLFLTARADGAPCVKVLDFGISKSTSPDDVSVTASAAVLGSPLYMSPEQLASSGSVDARSDVWALGVILYEMVTGKTPFTGESFATISAAILRGSYPPPSELCPGLPAPLEQAIAETLTRDPNSRPSSVAAFAARIAPCGSDAARASCRRVERIAARVAPTTPPPETHDSTLADGPPPSVVRAMQVPKDATQAPALSQSVDTGEQRPSPRFARLAIGAGGLGLLGAAAFLGLRGLGGASPTATAVPAVTTVAVDASPASASSAATPAPLTDAGTGWRATPLTAKDVDLGDFAVAAPPSADHPRGVVAALGFGELRDDKSFVTVVAIDLASEQVLASNPVGYATTGTTITDIASTPRGVVVAQQQAKALELSWFTGGTIDADSRTLPALAAKNDQDLRAFTTFGDRIVLATGGGGTTTVWILDAQGRLLTSHACHGGLFAPGPAELAQLGDDVVVTNFRPEGPNVDRVPVCAGSLHGPPRWREVTLHDGVLEPGVGGIYFTRNGGADRRTTNALDDNLQPTGLPPPPAATPFRREDCAGLTGTILRHAEELGGLRIVDMEACCGDPGGGLFICKAAEQGR